MKNFVKKYWTTLLFFVVIGLIGGFCVGLYALESYPAEMREQILAQSMTAEVLAVVSAIQSAGYGLLLGVAGILLAKKVGLWKDETHFEKKPLMFALIVSVVGGLAMILLDLVWFGNYAQAIRDSYLVKPTAAYMIGTVTYGAVIEEVMLRLFMMSLIAFVLHCIFERKREETAVWVLVAANIISALLFAAGHLPTTAIVLGLSPMILVRCFLLNGGIGLLFGWLYRKYGLRYAMIAHGGCHIVSKAIWILFL